MEILNRLINKYSTGRVITILFLFTMIVYIAMLSYSIPIVSAFAPQFPLFDLSPLGYSFTYANNLLNALGVEGRNLYLSLQLPLDFIYPGLFSITYTLLLVWLFGKVNLKKFTVNWLVLFPFLAGIFDYFENIFIIKMINSFPDLQESTVTIASTFTVLKSSFTMVLFFLLIMGFILLAKKKVTQVRE